MGSWSILDTLDPDGCPASEDAASFFVAAPSLRALPHGYPLAMATLPIVDWNAALLDALEKAGPADRSRCYAAVMMIDPFALWEDMADLLKSRGIPGVVNFPPALAAKGSSASAGADNAVEIERMRWFSNAGFKLAFAASLEGEAENAGARLPGLIDASVRLSAETWEKPITAPMRVDLGSATRESAGS